MNDLEKPCNRPYCNCVNVEPNFRVWYHDKLKEGRVSSEPDTSEPECNQCGMIWGDVKLQFREDSYVFCNLLCLSDFLKGGYHDKPITSLDLTARTRNCLLKENINSIGDLLSKTETQIRQIANLGSKSFRELKDELRLHNLYLRSVKCTGS